MKTWLLLPGGAAALATAAGLVLTAGPGASTGDGHVPDLARGAAIYAEACAACHGANLEGQPDWQIRKPDGRLPAPPHDATGHTWHHPDRVLLDITMRGTAAVVGGGYESDMPGFGDIYSEAELRDVLDWIKTRWPDRLRAHQTQITAQHEATR
jgi:mono/diheme cytochrome c family protein